MGDGANAGLVLNFPSQPSSNVHLPPQRLPTTRPLAPPIKKAKPITTTLASTRDRRGAGRKLREHRSTPRDAAKSWKKNKEAASKKRRRRESYKQEELLLEAVHQTEPLNQRWLLARKRVQDSTAEQQQEAAALRDKHNAGSVVQKYHSRRGCLITLTFPNMDQVPALLTHSSSIPQVQQVDKNCVITNKPARYKDPKTNLGYHDLEAFRELRRRLNAGEKLDQRPRTQSVKKHIPPSTNGKPMTKPAPSTVSSSNGRLPSSDTAAKKKTVAAAPTSSNGSPMPTKPVINLDSPSISPGRRSKRKWKPSEKVLQNIKDKGDPRALASAAATTTTVVVEKAKDSTHATMEKKVKPVSKKEEAKSTGKKKDASQAEKKVEAKSSKVKENGDKGRDERSSKKTVPKKKPPESQPKTASTPSSPGSEKVYVVPSEKASEEPLYITQSQLIMQAIDTYSRKRDGHPPPNIKSD